MWTRFMDMHSGGGAKEQWVRIYIEAPEDESKVIFYNRFGHNPERVTCTCCGEDYSISESETLESATGYDRGCQWDKTLNDYIDKPSDERTWQKYVTLEKYKTRPDILIISASEIKPEERTGNIPQQGYVWME